MLLPRPLHALALVLLAGAPAAAGNRIPVTGPGTITAPGDYILTTDIITPNLGPCNGFLIHATTGPIDLDLNWHTVEPGFLCSAVIVTGSSPVTVRNGYLTSTNGTVVRGLDSNLLRLVRVHVDGDWAIQMSDSSSLHMHQSSAHATVYGLFAKTTGDVVIDESTFNGAYLNVRLFRVGKAVVKNSFFSGANQGPNLQIHEATGKIRIGRNTFNSAQGSPGALVIAGDGAKIHRNSINGAGYDGLVVYGSGNSILRNSISGSNGCGILVDSNGNILQGNIFSGNLGGDVCAAP